MNGTRWISGDATDEPPAWCIGRRLIPEGAQHAHARVTGGVMDDTLRLTWPKVWTIGETIRVPLKPRVIQPVTG